MWVCVGHSLQSVRGYLLRFAARAPGCAWADRSSDAGSWSASRSRWSPSWCPTLGRTERWRATIESNQTNKQTKQESRKRSTHDHGECDQLVVKVNAERTARLAKVLARILRLVAGKKEQTSSKRGANWCSTCCVVLTFRADRPALGTLSCANGRATAGHCMYVYTRTH